MSERPLLISVFSVLGYIIAGIIGLFSVLFLIIGIFGFFNPIEIENVSGGELPAYVNLFQQNTSGWFFLVMFLVFLFLLALAILEFFVARGLWKGQNWSRILQIIFCGLSLLSGLSLLIIGNIFNGISVLFFCLLIGGYLLFNQNVKNFFSVGKI